MKTLLLTLFPKPLLRNMKGKFIFKRRKVEYNVICSCGTSIIHDGSYTDFPFQFQSLTSKFVLWWCVDNQNSKNCTHLYIFVQIWQKGTTMDMELFIWIVAFLVIPLNRRGKFFYDNPPKFHLNQQHTIPSKAYCASC